MAGPGWPSRMLCLGLLLSTGFPVFASVSARDTSALQEARRLDKLPPLLRHGKAHIDHSGRKEKGIASWYGPGFVHKFMADGNRMNPHANIAASKTLPLGTTARVVNLENGKSVTVKIEDRGPFVDGRVVDVSPKVAQELKMKHRGIVPVVVKPIAVPQPNGEVKLGAGAVDLSAKELERATKITEALIGDKATETASR